MESLIGLVNRIQRACTVLGDYRGDNILPTLLEALPSVVVVGGQSFWESLDRTVCLTRHGAMPCAHVRSSAGSNSLAIDDNVAERISRVDKTTHYTSVETKGNLIRAVSSVFGFTQANLQVASIKAGVNSPILPSSMSAEIYSGSGSRKGHRSLSFGKWMSWDALSAAQSGVGRGARAFEFFENTQEEGVRRSKFTLLSLLSACGHAQCLEWNGSFSSLGQSAGSYSQSKSAIAAASLLESAFKDLYVNYAGLETKVVLENILRQVSLTMDDSGGITEKGNSYLLTLVNYFSHYGWMEQGGNDNMYVSIFKLYGGLGLVRLGMLLHNHVISNDLNANVRFWSALADLYVNSGMLLDAYDVRKSLEISAAVPFRILSTGYTLADEFSEVRQEEGERANDRVHSLVLPSSHERHAKKGHHALKVGTDKGSKHFMNLSWSAGHLKDMKVRGPLFSSSMARRAMSTSTEKQCDEDLGEQQSPSQQPSSIVHQSSSQQQSSLEIPDSKPQGGSSWPNPDNAASYVLMSNIYADGDRWDEVKRINEMRLKARAWKKPGKAYVEIKAKVHEFIVGDRTHQDSVNIYEKLRKIKRHMGHIGYVPNVDLILENRSYYDPYKSR